jgi:hypothetical protein
MPAHMRAAAALDPPGVISRKVLIFPQQAKMVLDKEFNYSPAPENERICKKYIRAPYNVDRTTSLRVIQFLVRTPQRLTGQG